MEVRCGKCNKLFRVADERITGKGVKFACTRCHEPVQITRDDFENYKLSQTAVSALDLFEAKPKETASAPAAPDTGEADLSSALAAPAVPAAASETTSETSGADIFKEQEAPVSTVPPSVDDSSPLSEPFAPAAEDHAEIGTEPVHPTFSQPEDQSSILAEPEREASVFDEPVTLGEPLPPASAELTEPTIEEKAVFAAPAPQPGPPAEPQPAAAPKTPAMAKPEAAPQQPSTAPKPAPEPKPAAASRPVETREPAPGKTGTVPSKPAAARKEAARPSSPASPSAVIGAAPKTQPRSGSNLYLIVAAVIAVVGIGLAAYLYLGSSTPAPEAKAPVTPKAKTASAALVLSNTSGALQTNGDLLITGTVENTSDRPQSTWYVVVDIYDSAGAVLNRLRLLNGKQVHTRSDYEVFARRGIPVQDLKSRALEGYNVVVPPKGKVSFEVRYIQPPAGVASFNAALQPVDTAQVMKEIAEEAK